MVEALFGVVVASMAYIARDLRISSLKVAQRLEGGGDI
jgi:hypothetical protein